MAQNVSLMGCNFNVMVMGRIYFFWVLLFVLVVGSCSKQDDGDFVELMGEYEVGVINFSTQATKATSSDIDTMESDVNGFVVYGLEAGGTDWYDNIDGNRYVYDSYEQVWEWSSSKNPAWPEPFNQMNFYAFYPESALGFELVSSAPSYLSGDIVVQSSILDQTDYLAASSGDIVSKPLTGVQPLNFVHIMAKISFSVLQDEGVLTVIRQLGIENIINEGTYDYLSSQWYGLSNKNLGSFDDYVGSAGPFAKYGVLNQIDPIRIDGHELMLIPQSGGDGDSQAPLWDGSVVVDDSGEFVPDGAYISIRYRMETDDEDIIGYAFRRDSSNETEWDEDDYFYDVYKSNGSYTGPLFVKAGFVLSAEQLNWSAGSEYDYNLQLNKTGGVYLSEFYYDVGGRNTKIRVDGNPAVGDFVSSADMILMVTVNDWGYVESEIYPL